MAAVSGLTAYCPGAVGSSCRPRLLFTNQTCRVMRDEKNSLVQSFGNLYSRRKTLLFNTGRLCAGRAAVTGGRRNRDLSFVPELSPEEPFWLTLIKELIWSLKSMFSFLCEQPSQLKYIEWPSFQSTLKTATLTLVLVGLLIVALTSVDTVLSYVSRLLLRKTS